jgi:hypothetical protein
VFEARTFGVRVSDLTSAPRRQTHTDAVKTTSVTECQMIWESNHVRLWREVTVAYFEVLSQQYPEETEKNYDKFQPR